MTGLKPAEVQQMVCRKSGEGGERSLRSYERLPPLLSLLLPHLLPHTPPLRDTEKYAGNMPVKSHTRRYLTDFSKLLHSHPIYPNFASKPRPTERKLGRLVSVRITLRLALLHLGEGSPTSSRRPPAARQRQVKPSGYKAAWIKPNRNISTERREGRPPSFSRL